MEKSIKEKESIKEYHILQLKNIDEIRKVIYYFDKVFEPPLSKSVPNLNYYAEKLYRNAIVYIVKEEDDLIGFVAFYANDVNNRVCYLTQIAVDSKAQNKKVGKLLLDLCSDTSKNIGMTEIKLEVKNYNLTAINFYKRNGFNFYENASADSKYMIKKI